MRFEKTIFILIARYLTLTALLSLTSCAEPKLVQKPVNRVSSGSTDTLNCDVKIDSELCIAVKWETKIVSGEDGSMIVKVFRKNKLDQSPVLVDLVGELSMKLEMPSMAHDNEPTTTQKFDVGTYRVSAIFFTMTGPWRLDFYLTNPSGTIEKKGSLDVQVQE